MNKQLLELLDIAEQAHNVADTELFAVTLKTARMLIKEREADTDRVNAMHKGTIIMPILRCYTSGLETALSDEIKKVRRYKKGLEDIKKAGGKAEAYWIAVQTLEK